MRSCYFSFIATLMLLLTVACNKKNTTTYVSAPAKNTTISKTDTPAVSQITKNQGMYPISSAYIGKMNNVMNEWTGNLVDSASDFIVYVTQLSANIIYFTSDRSVVSSFVSYDSYNMDSSSIIRYRGRMIPGGIYDSADYHFIIIKDSFYASWSYERHIPGACDYGISTGNFAGKLQPMKRY